MKPFILFLLLSEVAIAASVTTGQNTNDRNGANLSETVLTPSSVLQLQKLGSYTVVGNIYAQPLVIDNVSVGSASKVMIIPTMHNNIYAFDADHPGSDPLWVINVGTSYTVYPTVTAGDFYQSEVGCVATPTIDTSTNIIYATCVSNIGTWRIYAINLADGSYAVAPVVFSGTNNSVTFVSNRHLQRSALLLLNGKIFVAFAGYGDLIPYQGWIFAYDAATLTQTAIICFEDNVNGEAGIWMSGGGLASDGLYVYSVLGNGDFNDTTHTEWGNAMVKLTQNLTVVDYFVPANYATRNSQDKDLNSGAGILIGTYYVAIGKAVGSVSDIYITDTASGQMGGLEGGAGPAIHQTFAAQNGSVFACTVFGNNKLFVAATNTSIKGFVWDGSSQFTGFLSPSVGATYANPGPSCAYSSNGSDTSTAIVWGVVPTASAFSTLQSGVLIAMSTSLAELWRSDTLGRDALGLYPKFSRPTVVNGKVYVASNSGAVVVYGFPTPQNPLVHGAAKLRNKVRIR